MGTYRLDRINGEMKKEVAEAIRLLKDPRISGLVSVVDADVTKDLKYAKIFVSVFETDETKKKEALKGIKSGAGFIRQELKKRMTLRNIPELTFVLDETIEYGAHINKILNEIETVEKDNE